MFHFITCSSDDNRLFAAEQTSLCSLDSFSRGGIKDGDILVKLNGKPLMTTADLQGALQEETALLLEVRRDNDDLLFNIEPDVIMQ